MRSTDTSIDQERAKAVILGLRYASNGGYKGYQCPVCWPRSAAFAHVAEPHEAATQPRCSSTLKGPRAIGGADFVMIDHALSLRFRGTDSEKRPDLRWIAEWIGVSQAELRYDPAAAKAAFQRLADNEHGSPATVASGPFL